MDMNEPKISERSKYTGVYSIEEIDTKHAYFLRKRGMKWRALLFVDGVNKPVGFFADDREAAKERDKMILKLGLKNTLQVLKRKEPVGVFVK